MKTITTLLLALGLPFVAQASSQQKTTTVNGHTVTVRTETTTKAPAVCQQAFDQSIEQQGRHDQIYRSVQGNQAFLIVSQKTDACMLKATSVVPEVKITLWKAVVKNGKTVTETRTYRLSPTQVNDFLDTELQTVAAEFQSAPISS